MGDIDLDIDIGIKKNIDLDIDLDLDFLGGKLLISILILKIQSTTRTTETSITNPTRTTDKRATTKNSVILVVDCISSNASNILEALGVMAQLKLPNLVV